MDELLLQDPELARAIILESDRQMSKLELIASENFVSAAVREAQGSVLTHKYAEGYPGKRYYGGCEYVDMAEQLAIDRARQLFGCEYANVQPHSGSQANMAAYLSCIAPGATILGMNLSHGGHLTHGSPVNFSGRLFKIISYGVQRETGRIDYDEVASLAREHKPDVIMAGASAYPRKIDFARFRAIADEVGAVLIVDMAHIAGLVAGGVHPSPFGYADIITTTTHKTLRGPRGGLIFCRPDLARKVDSAVFPYAQGGPLEHIIAGKAICAEEALSPDFKVYAEQVVKNCKAFADEFIKLGYKIVTGGTDNHVFLIDLSDMPFSGKDLQDRLDEEGITLNKNCVPGDKRGPKETAGVRVGTAPMTTRGYKEDDFREVARKIDGVVKAMLKEEN